MQGLDRDISVFDDAVQSNFSGCCRSVPTSIAPSFLICLPLSLRCRASEEGVVSPFCTPFCCCSRGAFLLAIAASSTCTYPAFLSAATAFFSIELHKIISLNTPRKLICRGAGVQSLVALSAPGHSGRGRQRVQVASGRAAQIAEAETIVHHGGRVADALLPACISWKKLALLQVDKDW